MREAMNYNKYSCVKFLAVVLLVLVQCCENICVSGSDTVLCREEERMALLHINASIPFSIHSLNGKWEGKECCQWERVTCDPITGHITQLDLTDDDRYDYQQGILDATLFLPVHQLRSLSLSGHGMRLIAGLETWSNLTKLEILDLSDNSLEGSIIYDLARVPSLRKLDLSYNNINNSNGFEYWSNLTKLQMLDLSDNKLPRSITSSLAKVSSLRALYLDFNNMMRVSINVPMKELSALNLEVISLTRCNFSGSFPDLGHWSSLKALSLAENDLSGTLISEGLCRLKNLEELDLSYNFFTGNLPLCMRNLSSLKLVDLSYNQFQVKFPSSILETLIFLRYLSLSYNQLEGTLSMRSFLNYSNLEVLKLSNLESLNFQVEVRNLPFQLEELELANCTLDVEPTFLYSQHKIRVLDLSNTRSKGPLSVVWFLLENNTKLVKLDLHKNFFTGTLQLPFLTHKNLRILDISNNHLGGELPANITTKLPNLESLTLSENYIQGPLPLMQTSRLEILDLSSNNLIDDIHNSLARILHSLSYLDLSNNQFYGSVPNHMNFTQAEQLLLNDNNISGEIPFSICNTSFVVLDLSNNKLNGVLPYCIGSAEIAVLYLSRNHLEGSLPLEMCAVKIAWLDLSDNKLSGSIPPCSNESALEIVDLSQNNLAGNFPITWLNISYIYAINIGENYLSGKLPIWISNESTLRMLLARENQLGGPIPKQICQFKYLRILDLSHNNLSGEIPSCIIDSGSADRKFPNYLGGIQYDSFLPIDYNDSNFLLNTYFDFVGLNREKSMTFGLELMSKGMLDFYVETILSIECVIDLSSNKLVGNIPEDIGRMNWLITLNLSNNYLSGAIPNSISNLLQLESLDLSHNSLTGKIPRELTKLTLLEYFTVAYNNLSGPTLGVEAQFSTFTNISYEGNPNLCGPPLSKSCVPTLGTTHASPNEMSDDRSYEGTDFLILFGSFSLFFVTSFWSFIVVLCFKRNWRYAMFTLADRYGDMIYAKVVPWIRKIGTTRTRRG